jgi:hypothetical protein
MKEYADIFLSEKNVSPVELNVTEELAIEFIDSLDLTDEQIDTISDQTKIQSKSPFWFEQRAGRVTASNFYTVCHMRETTDRTNIVKILMNYCPMEEASMPEQLIALKFACTSPSSSVLDSSFDLAKTSSRFLLRHSILVSL